MMFARVRSRLERALLRVKRRGHERYCPLCDSHVDAFDEAGIVPRPDASCPVCGSLERHRLLWLCLSQDTDLLTGGPRKVLHFAPERPIETRLRGSAGIDYLSADIAPSRAMVVLDVTAIDRAEHSFDLIICSHVLEHVPDDRKALAELHRILRPGGSLLVQVPITEEETIEDPTVTDPDERMRRFGNHDHVRAYGRDFIERPRDVGFDVSVFRPDDVAGHAAARLSIAREAVYVCRKQ